MIAAGNTDWNPGAYARFRGLRLRPAIDLLAQVPDLPPGAVVDPGCGNGAVGAALKARFADRRLLGIDTSPAMLADAAATGVYDELRPLHNTAPAWKRGLRLPGLALWRDSAARKTIA